MNNTDTNSNQNTSTRPSRKGNLNPNWGKKASQATRDKMSASHKAYQQRIHQMQSNNGQNTNYVMNPMTMQEFLSNNPQLDIKGYIKSLMKNEDVIRDIIREEIEKLLQQ
jgi:hypothetical protein